MSTSTVSATGIQDATGQVFANGTWSLSFQPAYGYSGPYNDGGLPFTKIFNGSLDGTGSFSQAGVARSDTIAPGLSKWMLQVSPAVGGQTFQLAISINSPAFDVTAAINAAIAAQLPGGITVSATGLARAYKDSELLNADGAGAIYYDETLKVLKVWDAATGVWVAIPNNLGGVSFLAPDGSKTAPGFGFSGAAGLGLYRIPATNLMMLAASSLDQVLIGDKLFRLKNGEVLNWSSNADPLLATGDIGLWRAGANLLTTVVDEAVTPTVGGSFQSNRFLCFDGTVGTPGFTFSDAQNAGFFEYGPGNWGWSSGGVGRWQFLPGSYTGVAGTVIGWNSSTGNTAIDTGFSRLGPASIAFGNGVNGDKTATIVARSFDGIWFDAATFTDIQTAIAAAVAAGGGVVDARSPNANRTMGAIDTGSNTIPVTLLLGPFTYTFTQITVRQGFNIFGAGYLNTTLQNVGTNANPAFVIPQVNNNAITIHWADFQVLALVGNTSQDGIFFDASTLTNAGVELSTFTNIQLTGFNGCGIHLKATQNGVSGSIGAIQELTFTNVTSLRPTGATGATQNALRIEGGCGQLDFFNCQLSGVSNDTGTNVFVGTNGIQASYSIHFHNTTNQNGFAYLFDGALGCTTFADHFENIKGCYNIVTTASPVIGFKATSPYINSNAAVNAGNGYIVNIPVGAPGVDVLVDSPFIGGQPDNGIKNLSNAINARIINAQINPLNTPVNVIPSSGSTFLGTPAATLDIHCCRTVQLSTSTTAIATLKSGLQPGETVTFYTQAGAVQFATGGNLSLGPNTSPLVVPNNGSVTFMRVDAGTPAFVWVGGATNTSVGNIPALTFGASAAITGTGAAANLYTGTLTGRTMGVGKGIRIKFWVNHSTGTASVTYAFSYAGTATSIVVSAVTGVICMELEFMNNPGSTAAQQLFGNPAFNGTAIVGGPFAVAYTKDTTVDQTLSITFNVANTDQVTPLGMITEVIQ